MALDGPLILTEKIFANVILTVSSYFVCSKAAKNLS